MMHRVVAGATGLIGRHLVNHWLAEGHSITVIGRNQDHIKQVFGNRVQAMTWQHLTPVTFESAECVVNLAGTNLGDRRFTPENKQDILQSRVNATKIITKHLAVQGTHAPLLFNASAIGIYGLQSIDPKAELPQGLTENTLIDWHAAPDFLAEVGRAWEQAANRGIEHGVKVVFLRFGVVLARDGGVLPKLLTPYQWFLGGKMGSGLQPFSWVAIDDVVRAIDFLLTQKTTGPFNIVAPQCVTQATFAKILAEVLHRKAFLTIPAWVLEMMMGKEMAQTLLLQGQHVVPARLQHLGFQFRYPDLKSALLHLLKNKETSLPA